MTEWIRNALSFAGDMSQAELARRMSELLSRSIGAAAVNKMLYEDGREGKQAIKADELYAISKITGYPIPPVACEHQHGVFGDWRSATPTSERILILSEESVIRLKELIQWVLVRSGMSPDKAQEAPEIILAAAQEPESLLAKELGLPPASPKVPSAAHPEKK